MSPARKGRQVRLLEPEQTPVPGVLPFATRRPLFQLFLSSLVSVISEDSQEIASVTIWHPPESPVRKPLTECWGYRISEGWSSLHRDKYGKVDFRHLPEYSSLPQLFPFVIIAGTPSFSFAIMLSAASASRDTPDAIIQGWFTLHHDVVEQIAAGFGASIPARDVEKSDSPSGMERLALSMLSDFGFSSARHEHRLNWLEQINKFAADIAWELDLSHLLTATTDGFKQAIGFDLFELHIFERNKQKFTDKLTWRRNDTRYGGKLMTVELQPALIRAIYRHRHAVFIPDLLSDEYVLNPKLLHITELKAAILLPLVYDRRVHGILKLFFRDPQRIKPDDIDWLTEMSNLLTRSLVNSRTYATATQLASIDGLTGVINRRAFFDQLNREFKRSQRFGGHLSIIMVDVDHFKNYNDREGHLPGDLVLRGIADLMKSNVRETDYVARYGGEEFCVLLPGATLDGATLLAEKLRTTIESFNFVNGHLQPLGRITISVGVSTTTPAIHSQEELVHQADMALYQAKEHGRNRVFYNSGTGNYSPASALLPFIVAPMPQNTDGQSDTTEVADPEKRESGNLE